jgi:hypothetical protein
LYSTKDENDNENIALDLKTFQHRKDKFHLQTRQRKWHQPPNPLLEGPIDFVQALLQALEESAHQDGGGALVLLQSSTPSWRNLLLRSVGAPDNATDGQVAHTLQAALERPNNQFAILMKNKRRRYVDDANHPPCKWHFPSDPLDFQDGTCWVESRLRSTRDDELLVATGWSLEKRSSDGAWLLSGLDWQDFRENFRPGIGREEWERICG